MAGNDSALARIARIRKAKAEIHWPTNVLRITADKTTAEYTADDVEAALSKARTTSLDLKLWFGQLNEAKVAAYPNLAAALPIEYVSSLTGTNIIVSSDHTVCCIEIMKSAAADEYRLKYTDWTKRLLQKRNERSLGYYLSRSLQFEQSIHRSLTQQSRGAICRPYTMRRALWTSIFAGSV